LAVSSTDRCKQLEFLRQIASNPANIAIGLVRNVAETEAKITAWKGSNVHIIRGDLDDYESLQVWHVLLSSDNTNDTTSKPLKPPRPSLLASLII
jgi:hypothetical protein